MALQELSPATIGQQLGLSPAVTLRSKVDLPVYVADVQPGARTEFFFSYAEEAAGLNFDALRIVVGEPTRPSSEESAEPFVVRFLKTSPAVTGQFAPVVTWLRLDTPCLETFEYLAEHDPPRLLRWLAPGELRDVDLSFAAEAAGRIQSTELVAPSLLSLLGHDFAPVREGAVYGLERHLDALAVRDALSKVARDDSSPGVRAAAQEALELLDDEARTPAD